MRFVHSLDYSLKVLDKSNLYICMVNLLLLLLSHVLGGTICVRWLTRREMTSMLLTASRTLTLNAMKQL